MTKPNFVCAGMLFDIELTPEEKSDLQFANCVHKYVPYIMIKDAFYFMNFSLNSAERILDCLVGKVEF